MTWYKSYNQKLASRNSVLIVDDDMDWVYLSKYYLRKLGFNTFAALNIEDAILDLEMEPSIGCIISDFYLHQENGGELVSRVKQNPELKELPIILCTVNGNDPSVQKIPKDHIHSIIEKPFNEYMLKKVLTSCGMMQVRFSP